MPKDLLLFGPELMLLGGALLVFIASIAKEPKSEATWGMALLASFAAVGLSLLTLHERGAPFFPGIYRVDLFSQLLKLGLSALLCGVILISRNLPSVRPSARVDAPHFAPHYETIDDTRAGVEARQQMRRSLSEARQTYDASAFRNGMFLLFGGAGLLLIIIVVLLIVLGG